MLRSSPYTSLSRNLHCVGSRLRSDALPLAHDLPDETAHSTEDSDVGDVKNPSAQWATVKESDHVRGTTVGQRVEEVPSRSAEDKTRGQRPGLLMLELAHEDSSDPPQTEIHAELGEPPEARIADHRSEQVAPIERIGELHKPERDGQLILQKHHCKKLAELVGDQGEKHRDQENPLNNLRLVHRTASIGGREAHSTAELLNKPLRNSKGDRPDE